MKKILFLFFLCVANFVFSQTDYSNSWEDFYSYNNVKDFTIKNDILYALTDNAVFTYNLSTEELTKLSSIQGLSGERTSAFYFDENTSSIVIGYESGLVEVINDNREISITPAIVNFNQAGSKSINHIAAIDNRLFLATSFAIVTYNLETESFGDTFFIGEDATSLKINQISIFDNQIYAATENGILFADVNSNNLIDFNSWTKLSSGNFSQISVFNNQLYATQNSTLFRLENGLLSNVKNYNETIVSLKSDDNQLSIGFNKSLIVLDSNLNQTFSNSSSTEVDYSLNTALLIDNQIYIATKEFGVLSAVENSNPSFQEIHPDGPLSNDVFSLSVKNQNLWVVYGGFNVTFAPAGKIVGYSRFSNSSWKNTRFNSTFPARDLVNVTIDPENSNKAYISSFGGTSNINSVSTGGLLVVEDDEPVIFYNQNNSSLEDIEITNPNFVTIRTNGSIFDNEGNFWITNIGVDQKLKKLAPDGTWSGFNLSDIETNRGALGMFEIDLDRNNNFWIGTRGNGVYVFNENGNKRALLTSTTRGALPDLRVQTIKIDASNRVWMGTRTGLAVYNNAATIFENTSIDAAPIIILDDGIPKRLLGDQDINSIAIDGADNKWFGTSNGGVLYTNPNGQTTLANFNTRNSPLPSNTILKIAVDTETGKVYFATEGGIVAYNSNVAPFGEKLGEVYAYPNPALKNHQTVTIDGRNNTNLPKGTNVKILDVAGNLVYETNVIEGQEIQGGKVVWDKTNLRGNKVASGVYVVLLINEDGSQTSMTKIAIVN